MTTVEKNVLVKASAVSKIAIPVDAIQIGDYTYALSVGEIDGVARYAKVDVTALLEKDTKVNKAFNPTSARDVYLALVAERERKAAEKAAKSAE